MHETSLSLLAEVRKNNDSEAWSRLVEMYAPLMRRWLRAYEVQDADADDLIQDVLAVVARDLAKFDHNQRQGAFRSWLRGILVNRLREYWRKRGRLDAAGGGSDLQRRLNALEDPRSHQSRIWDREHDEHLVRNLLSLIEPRFSESTRAAFRQLVFDGQKPVDVAADLQLSLSAVFTAKSRVLRELRRIGEGLID